MSEKPEFTKTLEQITGTMEKGTTFAGRYRVLGELGKGGMGLVYKVHDTQIDEEVALKLLKDEIARDQHVLERFRNELKFARKITHKSVCRMFDINQSEGTTYITMEFVEGENLKSVIRRKGKLGIGQALGVALQITDGLFEAHDLGIVHRDLKPQNIMIDPEGNAKIMDFGIARSTSAESVTREGAIIGTPEYMSPEQVEGKPVDHRSDIYSLGVILYEMLTGNAPFTGETSLDVALKHKAELPTNPRELNRKIPEDLADLILCCMAKDSKERFQNSGELLKALAAIEESLPSAERSAQKIVPRVAGKKTTAVNLRKVAIPTAAVAAIVVVGLIAWRLIFPPPADERADMPTLAILNFDNNTGDKNLDIWRENLADYLIGAMIDSKHLNVVTHHRLSNLLEKKGFQDASDLNEADLLALLADLNATHLIRGSFTQAGTNFRIDITLLDANKLDPIGASYASGLGLESLHFLPNDLADKLKPHLGMTQEEIENDVKVNAADLTPSGEAYNFFIQAKKARAAWKQEEAITHLEKAVALDPDFAVAYRWLGYVHNGIWAYNSSQEHAQARQESYLKAQEAMQRRPVNEKERLIIEADCAFWLERDRLKHREIFMELGEKYPNDFYTNHILGYIYFNSLEDYDKAISYFEKVIRSDEAEIGDYLYQGYMYRNRWRYEQARDVMEKGIQKYPNQYDAHQELGLTYVLEGKYDHAFEEFEKAYRINPLDKTIMIRRGEAYYFKEDFPAAEAEFRKYMEEEPKGRGNGKIQLIRLYLLQGRYDDIIDHPDLSKRYFTHVHIAKADWESAEKTCEAWKPNNPLYANVYKPHLLGLIKARLKKWGEAQEIADTLLNDLDDRRRAYAFRLIKRHHLHLQGRIELAKGNLNEAADYLEQVKGLLVNYNKTNYAWYTESLAKTYYEMGELEKARIEYELITKLRGGRYNRGDIYAKSFYNMGKISEELGNKKEAKKQYTRFLELWENADPWIPELQDAKVRMEALR